MTEYDSQLKGIWRQTQTPVLFRRGMGYPLLLKLPYAPDNRGWIRNGQRSKPIWCDQYKCWEVPQAWFEKTIRAAFPGSGAFMLSNQYVSNNTVRLHAGMHKASSVSALVWGRTMAPDTPMDAGMSSLRHAR